MDKVLLFAGTTEGRRLAEFLERYQVPVHVCVATEYGETLLEETDCRTVHGGRMDAGQMCALIQQEQISLAVDATHPYARVVSENIRTACSQAGISYLRLQRECETTCGEEELIRAESVKEAVGFLAGTSGNILVTTGSKELAAFASLPGFRERVYARVLSTEESVSISAAAGIQGKHLICMQGPFSEELNTAMLKHVKAKWLVTKESGKQGGFLEKVRSAKAAGARILVIKRPAASEEESDGEKAKTETGSSCEKAGTEKEAACAGDEMEIRRILCKRLAIPTRRKISIIGIGMGTSHGMTGEAYSACREAQLLIGAKRMLHGAAELKKPFFEAYRAGEILAYVKEHPEYERIAILLSGDVGFYSGAKELRKVFEKEELRIYPGISSVAYLCAKKGLSWEDVKLTSLHGREQNLISAVMRHKKVFALIGTKEGVQNLCKKLLHYGLDQVDITVGERMSYPEERILCGRPGELLEQEFDALSSVIIQNENALSQPVHGIPDEAFLRAKVPMTKCEVRSVSLSKLGLTRDAVVMDVGAGTGSVAVEMALQAWDGHVYAIEKKAEAVALLKENKRKFCADHLTVVEGLAPEALSDLPAPTHVFIGGSSGNLKEIMEAVLNKNPSVRIVINAIALETAAEALTCLKCLPVTDTDIVTVQAARAKEIGDYHMMMGQNPVYVISCTGRGGHE